MRSHLAVLALALFSACPASAQEFVPVSDEAAFLSLLDGRELRLGVVGLALSVNPDGTIIGAAAGFEVTGSWTWQDGYFCREMDWSGKEIVYDCQLVEMRDGKRMRFTERRGEGDSASFDLR